MKLTGATRRLFDRSLHNVILNHFRVYNVSKMSAIYQTEFDRENGISSIIETLGGSGVTQIFVHNVMSLKNISETIKSHPEFEKYDERALVYSRPDDVVCVLEKVDNQYLKFLSSMGIGPKSENIVAVSNGVKPNSSINLSDLLIDNPEKLLTIRRLIKPGKKIVLNPYIFSAKESKLAEILKTVLGKKVHLLGGDSDIVEYADQKHNIKQKASEIGIPVPKGEIIELRLVKDRSPKDLTPIHLAIKRFICKTGKVMVKGSYGTSGSSIVTVEENTASIQEALCKIAERNDNSIYIVEEMFDVVVSPNVLIHIEPDEGRILCVGVTDQILSKNLEHEGNIYPAGVKTLKDMMSSALNISKWLQNEGYSGILGLDFVEYVNPETGYLDYFLAEINPRINAATYPKSLMEHLNRKQAQKGGPYIEAFLSKNIKTKAGSFTELNELYGHLFFNPETGRGLFPYNTGCLVYGKFTLAIFGRSRDEVIEMYHDFKTLLDKE